MSENEISVQRKALEAPSDSLENYYPTPVWKITRKSGSLKEKFKEMCGEQLEENS